MATRRAVQLLSELCKWTTMTIKSADCHRSCFDINQTICGPGVQRGSRSTVHCVLCVDNIYVVCFAVASLSLPRRYWPNSRRYPTSSPTPCGSGRDATITGGGTTPGVTALSTRTLEAPPSYSHWHPLITASEPAFNVAVAVVRGVSIRLKGWRHHFTILHSLNKYGSRSFPKNYSPISLFINFYFRLNKDRKCVSIRRPIISWKI